MKYEPIRPYLRAKLKINIEVYQNETTATCSPRGRTAVYKPNINSVPSFSEVSLNEELSSRSQVFDTLICQQEDFNCDPRGEQKVEDQHRINPPGDGASAEELRLDHGFFHSVSSVEVLSALLCC